MKIRRIREEDIIEIAHLALQAQKREEAFDTILKLGEEALPYIHAWLRESMAMGGTILVAEQRGKIAGFVWGWIVEKPHEIFKVERVGYIYQIYASEQLKNIKLKQKLLEAIIMAFKENGISHIIADCYVDDEENIELYEKHGFKPRALTLIKRIGDRDYD